MNAFYPYMERYGYKRLREKRSVAIHDEREVARRWWKLPPTSLLPISDGTYYQLVYHGRPGGSAGPDVRDAVLLSPSKARLVGDIEFHTQASDWKTHQHHLDPRYNQVILHVVLRCDDPQPTIRQDGSSVPLCSLYDLAPLATYETLYTEIWPCQTRMAQMSVDEQFRLLQRAGLLRFEQKTHAFVEQLHHAAIADDYDRCLLLALAEGLGYGRDRAFFRAVGARLLTYHTMLPEPLGRAAEPSPLDTQRLRVLRLLITRWQHADSSPLWQTLTHTLLHSETPQAGQAIRAIFTSLRLSLARTDILVCNVVLPFAAAVALLQHDNALFTAAERLYCAQPTLSSNAITRMMSRQLQLTREPRGGCQQQGLQYIYQQACREKHCALCIAGRGNL